MQPLTDPDLLTAANLLHWNEPDSGCVSCGQPYMTVVDHRCGTCIGEPVNHCPMCLADIASLIDREVVRRVREASWAVSEGFTDRQVLRRLTQAQRAVEFRRQMGLRP